MGDYTEKGKVYLYLGKLKDGTEISGKYIGKGGEQHIEVEGATKDNAVVYLSVRELVPNSTTAEFNS